jgi:dTDP-4-amino-4,6-dideoxygalactose transaminase
MGRAQLAKSQRMLERRREIAQRYTEAFAACPQLQLPYDCPQHQHAWHLYMLRLELDTLSIGRAEFIDELKRHNIGTSVHFIPLHIHPYYRETYGYDPGDYPVAYQEYQRVISLPIYSKMNEQDVEDVIGAVTAIIEANRR